MATSPLAPLAHYIDSIQDVLAPDLSFLRSRLHRQSRAGWEGGCVSSVFPQEPPSGTVPSRVWFFILPVWQLVCKQYMAVLYKVPKPYVNGVASAPQGPAPLRCILVSCVPQMCLFLSSFDHSVSGLPGRLCWQMSCTYVFVHLCLSFWKD